MNGPGRERLPAVSSPSLGGEASSSSGSAGRDRGSVLSNSDDRALLATLRHDLCTPLNAILGYSAMLLEDDDALATPAKSLAPGLRRIVESGTELLKLVNESLDHVHLDAGLIELGNVGAALNRDLRAPITTIIGYGEMLREDAAALGRDDAIPDIEKVCQAADRFLDLFKEANRISAASTTLGSARQDPDFEPGDISTAALVHDAITSIRAGELRERFASTEQGAILVVDDNEFNRDVLERHLERQGHAVTAVEDGRSALDSVQSQSFDLILLDLLMPGINGYDVLIQLKANAATHDIPVIVISALDDMDAVVRCIEAGAEDYLPKPFNPTLLRARTSACLEKKRLRDQEKEYLRHVAQLTTAAAAVEACAFDPQTLAPAARRSDALGQLARVFQRMAVEVHQREQRLKQEVQQLRIEIDSARLASEVTTITESDFFVDLERKAEDLRTRRRNGV